MPERVRAGAMRRLRTRIDRLERLLADNAPTAIIAREADLIGKVAWELDPVGMGDHLAGKAERGARRLYGACVVSGCDDAPPDAGTGYDADHCFTHAAEMRSMESELVQEDPDVDPS